MQTLKILRIILLPFSWLYGAYMAARNWAFNKGINKSFKFDFPVIAVGNLSTGGTGKTPHIEFLISLLKNKYPIGVVSRGYGRKTKGFLMVDGNSVAADVGDEPLQIKLNHPQAAVAVGEHRLTAIPSLLLENPETRVVLLDDAYQHRYVRAGMYIMLTDYSRMFYDDFVLPAGNLREFRVGYKRASIIIVTKCPATITQSQKQAIIQKINPVAGQQVYFTGLQYGLPYKLGNPAETIDNLSSKQVMFFAGIANTASVEDYLKQNAAGYRIMKLADHYKYSPVNLAIIAKNFKKWEADKKILLTTQKDAVKLAQSPLSEVLKDMPVYVLPLEIKMDEGEKTQFITTVETYLTKELSIQSDDK